MCFITPVLESAQAKLRDPVAGVSAALRDRVGACGARPGVGGSPGDLCWQTGLLGRLECTTWVTPGSSNHRGYRCL